MPNRRRKNQVKFYMDDDELLELDEKVSSTQMSRGEYLRAIAHGLQPVAKPDIDYAEVIRQLHYIGNNIRQLAIKAYYTNNVNSEVFMKYTQSLDEVVSGLVKEMHRRTMN